MVAPLKTKEKKKQKQKIANINTYHNVSLVCNKGSLKVTLKSIPSAKENKTNAKDYMYNVLVILMSPVTDAFSFHFKHHATL